MYAVLQTAQAPFQFNWCGNGLGEYTSGIGVNTIYHLAPTTNATGGVYANINGTSAPGNVYTNKRGTLTYSLVKTGDTTGTIITPPPYIDACATANINVGTTYNLTITDGGNGQKYLFTNNIIWGAL